MTTATIADRFRCGYTTHSLLDANLCCTINIESESGPLTMLGERNRILELSALLDSVIFELPFCDAIRVGSELYGAPRLSVFNIFEINEAQLSRIIADLVDPAGTHGQGPLFLNALLECTGLVPVSLRESVSVSREFGTIARRRIDILIETSNSVVGIENKPWALQQEKQLADYLDELMRISGGKKAALIFISDQFEKSAKNKVIRFPYYDFGEKNSLYTALKSTLNEIKAPPVRAFIEEFIAWINVNFGEGNMTDTLKHYINMIEGEYEKGTKNRRALAAVMLASDILHRRVLDAIGDYINSEFRNRFSDTERKEPIKLSKALSEKCHTWMIRRKSWPKNCWIGIESGRGEYRQVYYGIVALDPKSSEAKDNGTDICAQRGEVEKALKGLPRGGKMPWWPWWKMVDEPTWTIDLTARLLLEAQGDVEKHPEVKEFTRYLLQLAQALDGIESPVIRY
jgi:hypothetical protein